MNRNEKKMQNYEIVQKEGKIMINQSKNRELI